MTAPSFRYYIQYRFCLRHRVALSTVCWFLFGELQGSPLWMCDVLWDLRRATP